MLLLIDMLWKRMPSLKYFYVRIANGGLVVPLLRAIFRGSLPQSSGYFPVLQMIHVDVHFNARGSTYPPPTFRPFEFCTRDYRTIFTREEVPELRQIWIHIMDTSLCVYDEEQFLNTLWDQTKEDNVVRINISDQPCHSLFTSTK